MKRALTVLAVAIGVAACTPQEHAAWLEWHEKDPEAAEAFADAWVADHIARGAPEAPQGRWDRLAECESGGDWHINTGNGYFGGLQFLDSTWDAYGGEKYASRADLASREAQIDIAERVLADVGWGAWPACSRKLGLR